jgi:hypothetical protein
MPSSWASACDQLQGEGRLSATLFMGQGERGRRQERAAILGGCPMARDMHLA